MRLNFVWSVTGARDDLSKSRKLSRGGQHTLVSSKATLRPIVKASYAMS